MLGTTSSLTYTDSTVPAAGSYSYSVKAEDWAGQPLGRRRQDGRVRQPAADHARRLQPGRRRSATKPTMSWTAATDTGGAGIDHYEVWRDGSPTCWPAARPRPASPTPRSRPRPPTRTTSSPSTRRATAAPPTAVKSITYDVTAPTVPAGLAASASPTGAKPALAFSAATDTGGTGVATYRLYRDGAFVATAAGTTVSDTALPVDGSYSYRVSALDAAGNESALSAAVPSSTTRPRPRRRPA